MKKLPEKGVVKIHNTKEFETALLIIEFNINGRLGSKAERINFKYNTFLYWSNNEIRVYIDRDPSYYIFLKNKYEVVELEDLMRF